MLARILGARPENNKKIFWTVVSALLLVFVGLCALQWTAPAIEDEFIQHKCALIWLAKGADYFELVHTPLLHELTSIWQKIFGAATIDRPENVAILRSFGVFTSVVTALVFLWGLLVLKPEDRQDSLASLPVLALAVLVFHPYFVQSALLMEYDTTVLPAPLLLAAILIERWDAHARPKWWLTIMIAGVLAVALFGKELTPVIFFPLWIAWAALRKLRNGDWKPGLHLGHAIAGSALGVMGAVALLWLWGTYRGFHWFEPLLTTRDKFFGRAAAGGLLPWRTWGWERYLFLVYLPFLWIGLPTFAGFGFLASKLVSRLRLIPFSLWAAFAIVAAYTWIVQAAYYFPKYSAPAWPLFLYGMARLLPITGAAPELAAAPAAKHARRFLFAVCIALFALGLSPLFDPLMMIEFRSQLSAGVVATHALALLLPTLLIGAIFRKRAVMGTIAVFAGLISLYIGTDVSHITRNHSTRYLYGEHGFSETLATLRSLRARVSPNDKILTIARDLDWSLGDQSQYWDLQLHVPPHLPEDTRIVASRSYGEFSVRGAPWVLDEVSRAMPCHAVNPEPGHRFEWWWKPLPGEGCE